MPNCFFFKSQLSYFKLTQQLDGFFFMNTFFLASSFLVVLPDHPSLDLVHGSGLLPGVSAIMLYGLEHFT